MPAGLSTPNRGSAERGSSRGGSPTATSPGRGPSRARPLAYSDGIGIVQGRTDYPDDDRVYANLWVITFADDARARSFVEWYMEPGPVREDQE